jgi:hypothetical protein
MNYATETLAVLRAHPRPELPEGAFDGFAALLEDWRPIADRDEKFRWSSEERPERAQYLIRALYVAGTIIEDEAAAGRASLRPREADEFHLVLVQAVLDALERESAADAHFVQEIRNIWDIARRD